MAKIAFVVTDDGGQRAKVLSLIRRATGAPYSEISTALDSAGLVLEKKLFGRDHDGVAASLRALVSTLSAAGASFEIYELPESQSLAVGGRSRARRIETSVLENILAAHEDGLRQQQESTDRELGESDDGD